MCYIKTVVHAGLLGDEVKNFSDIDDIIENHMRVGFKFRNITVVPNGGKITYAIHLEREFNCNDVIGQ